ncbi:MAG: hypothetical protein ACUVQ1_00820 [Candidatus Kapaibacteriales bacterium]
MEIKSIKHPEVSSFDSKEKIYNSTSANISNKTKNGTFIEDLSDWQVSVLQIAKKYLENIEQMENNHPLGRREYKTIETFEEALKELERVYEPKFMEEAKAAQANLTPEQVLHLFIQ